jgi:UDP-N-acetyl-D-mannosaminuronate dehydrogenase
VTHSGKPLVVGMGEVGSALAAVLEATGPVLVHDVKPVDISEAVSVMHICFPYCDAEQFKTAATSYIRRFNPPLVVINSTVVPGTTRDLAKATGATIAYSPVRGKHVKMAEDLRRYTKFVSALRPAVARQAEEHFQAAGMKTHAMECPETLELAKLAETTYFGLQITFAQELNRYASKVHADYFEATRFFEEIDFLPSQPYFPGFIGGHCVIPNIHLLQRVAASPLLRVILESNELRRIELELATAPGQSDGVARDTE